MDPADVVLRATNLGKAYTRYRSQAARLLDHLTGTPRRGQPHWALRGLDLELHRGELVGVIGRNGAGKSTLLQILAGVLQPTEGRLETHGRTLAMLELGAGFDPDATGEQNTRTQLAIWNIPKADWPAKTRAVAAFADIGDAFQQPVKTYSSGMFMRLAFAVTTALDPDILIVDEVLAVGDIFFQQKCHERLRAMRAQGCAVVLASHDLAALGRHASRALLLERGRSAFAGPVAEASHRFLVNADPTQPAPRRPLSPVGRPARNVIDAHGAALLAVAALDNTETPVSELPQGAWLTVVADYEVAQDGLLAAGFELLDANGLIVHARTSLGPGASLQAARSGALLRATHRLRLDLAPGEYTVSLGLGAFPADLQQAAAGMAWRDLVPHLRILHRTGPELALRVAPPPGVPQRFHGLVDLASEARLDPVRSPSDQAPSSSAR